MVKQRTSVDAGIVENPPTTAEHIRTFVSGHALHYLVINHPGKLLLERTTELMVIDIYFVLGHVSTHLSPSLKWRHKSVDDSWQWLLFQHRPGTQEKLIRL
jgi:alanine dehydrogenase